MTATLQQTGSIPRVLLILDNLTISGAEKVAVNLLRHAAAANLSIEGLVYMDDLVGSDQCGGRMRARRGATGGSFLHRLARGAARLPELARIARSFDILVPVTPPVVPWALAAGAVSGAKVVPWVHYDLEGLALEPFTSGRRLRDGLMNGLHTKVVPAFDELLFVSQGALNSFARRYGGTKPGWQVVPNLYDPAPLTEVASSSAGALHSSKSSDLNGNKAVLLFLGRICRQKRWEEALRVAELLHSQHFRFELHFVGDGPESGSLQSAIAQSPAHASLFFHGADPNPMPTLAAADALLLTSLHEAWPTVILEAFDLGTPVFSLDCPSGPAEMLGRHMERGVLCQDANAVAKLIPWLLASGQADLRMAMTARARSFLAEYQPERALVEWAQALRALMPR